jgi:hypothetical protein
MHTFPCCHALYRRLANSEPLATKVEILLDSIFWELTDKHIQTVYDFVRGLTHLVNGIFPLIHELRCAKCARQCIGGMPALVA